jgi:hypothetical protein
MEVLITLKPNGEVIGGNGGAGAPASYSGTLLTHWAEAVVDAPVRNITRYDEAAKLLVTIAAPVQAALFALYEKVGGILDKTPPWFLVLMFSFSIISVLGVVFFVIKVCDERLRLRIDLPASCEPQDDGLISYLLDDTAGSSNPSGKTSSAVKAWEKHVEHVADCKHKWLSCAAYCFVTGSLMPLLLLIGLAVSKW